MSEATAKAAQPGGLWRRVLPFWLLFSAAFLAFRWDYVTSLRQADPDDTLRLIQVRDLLAGQGWFDLHQYRINPPDGVVMHWSRLVDLPIAALDLLLRPVLGTALAEKATLAIVPLLTFGVLLFLLAKLARRLFDDRLIGYAALLAGTSFPVITQVMPTRIDHHGWQIVAAVAAMLGLTDPDPRRGGRVAGLALALGMAISLELLPLAAVFGAVFALDWLLRRDGGARFTNYMAALAVSAFAAFALTRGPDLTNYCDAVSPAYLAALGIMAGGSLLTARLAPASPLRIVLGLGLSAAASAAALVLIAPACKAGPFAALDPLLQAMWASNVLEAMPVWELDNPAKAQWIIPPAAALIAAFMLWRSGDAERRRLWLSYGLALAGAMLLGTLVLRSMSFAVAYANVPLAWLVRSLVGKLETARGLPHKLGVVAMLLIVVMPALPVYLYDTAMGVEEDKATTASGADDGASTGGNPVPAVTALKSLPAGTIFAPLDQGPWILLNTAHSVVATGHHRGARPMHDVMVGFIVDPPVARHILRQHGVRYVVLVPESNEVKLYRSTGPTGLAAQLSAGRVPDWLEPLPMPKGTLGFRVIER